MDEKEKNNQDTPPWSVLILIAILGHDPSQMALAQLIYAAVASTVGVIMTPLTLTAYVLVYYDLRIRKEAFDLQRLSEALVQPAAI